jgi:L-lactate dehydrogenase (cytochrome)
VRARRADRTLELAPATYDDFRELSRRRLPRQLFDYIDGGAFAENSMRANADDLRALRVRQRVLRDVSTRHLTTTVLGETLSIPLVLAPVGFAGMFAPRAEVLAARAAERTGITFCESTLSICAIEEVATATNNSFWFQLYVMKDRGYAEDLIARAKAAGCTTLVLTVDLAVTGRRFRDARNGLNGGISSVRQYRRKLDIASHPRWVREVALGGRPLTFGNLESAVPAGRVPQDFQQWVAGQFDPSVTWRDLEWLRSLWDGKIVLKGILDLNDAREARANGADAIVVSNHGGRQLDDVTSTIRALPAIADAVGGELEILMDGGVRSGLDVVKALALGANACLIGRPWVYAVAARGEQGVVDVIESIRADLMVALALTGVTNVADLDLSVLENHDGARH